MLTVRKLLIPILASLTQRAGLFSCPPVQEPFKHLVELGVIEFQELAEQGKRNVMSVGKGLTELNGDVLSAGNDGVAFLFCGVQGDCETIYGGEGRGPTAAEPAPYLRIRVARSTGELRLGDVALLEDLGEDLGRAGHDSFL